MYIISLTLDSVKQPKTDIHLLSLYYSIGGRPCECPMLATSLPPQSTPKLAVEETFKVKRVKASPIPEAFSSFEKILER